MQNKKVKCPFCGKRFKILSRHITSCQMNVEKLTLSEFKKKYFISYKEMIISHFHHLHFPSHYPLTWLSCSFYHRKQLISTPLPKTNYGNHRPWGKLNNGDIASHFNQRTSLGHVFSNSTSSPFIVFDIDNKNNSASDNEMKCVTTKLITELAKFFPPEDIHLVFSGGKGFHVWIYFENIKPSHAEAIRFSTEVTNFNINNKNVNIEIRPNNATSAGTGIFYPLGIHRKSKKFMCYLDKDTFKEVDDSYDYFLKIQGIKEKITGPEFWDNLFQKLFSSTNIRNTYSLKNTSSLTSNSNQSIAPQKRKFSYHEVQDIYQNGLPEQGIRNDFTWYLTRYLYSRGMSEGDIIEAITNWTNNEHSKGRTKDSGADCQHSITQTARNVVSRNLPLYPVASKLSSQLEGILDFAVKSFQENNNYTKKSRSKQKEAINIIFRLATKVHQNGFFYINKKKLKNSLKYSSFRSVDRLIKTLLECNLFIVAKKGVPIWQTDYIANHGHATLYYSNFLQITEQEMNSASVEDIFHNLSNKMLFQLFDDFHNGRLHYFYENIIIKNNKTYSETAIIKYCNDICYYRNRVKQNLVSILQKRLFSQQKAS